VHSFWIFNRSKLRSEFTGTFARRVSREKKISKKVLLFVPRSDKPRGNHKKEKSVDALLAFSLQVTFHTQIHPHHNYS
jgi:hypothetical protein